jgi:hypothetical protein
MGAKIPAVGSPGRRGDCNLFYGAQYFWVYSIQFGLCRPSVVWNCEIINRFLEKIVNH